MVTDEDMKKSKADIEDTLKRLKSNSNVMFLVKQLKYVTTEDDFMYMLSAVILNYNIWNNRSQSVKNINQQLTKDKIV